MRLLPGGHRHRVIGVAYTAVLLFTAGCAGEIATQHVVAQDAAPPTVADPTAVGPAVASVPPAKAGPSPAHRRALNKYFLSRLHPDGFRPLYTDLADLLPNVAYQRDGEAEPLSHAVVHGKIVDLVPADSYKLGAEGQSVRIKYGDPRAMWSTAVLMVDVLQRLGPGAAVADRIEVMLPINSTRDLERIRPGLKAMESVVLFLRADGATLKNYPGKYRIIENGELLTEVIGDALRLPWIHARDPAHAKSLLAGTPTLSDLKQAAERPREIRAVP